MAQKREKTQQLVSALPLFNPSYQETRLDINDPFTLAWLEGIMENGYDKTDLPAADVRGIEHALRQLRGKQIDWTVDVEPEEVTLICGPLASYEPKMKKWTRTPKPAATAKPTKPAAIALFN